MALGVFDSGVGGLTVYRELEKAFPKTDMIYLGDTARLPYGNKSPDTIIRNAKECAYMLINNYGVNALIIACNTISSCAIEPLQKTFGVPVMGVIEAGSKKALEVTANRKIGIVGTIATVRSNMYVKMLNELSGYTVQTYQQACPLFVPLVEEGLIDGDIPRLAIHMYLDNFVGNGMDTLILGCTHYPILAPAISRLYPGIRLVDSATVMVDQIRSWQLDTIETGRREILVTDDSMAFESLKNMLVGPLSMYLVKIPAGG